MLERLADQPAGVGVPEPDRIGLVMDQEGLAIGTVDRRSGRRERPSTRRMWGEAGNPCSRSRGEPMGWPEWASQSRTEAVIIRDSLNSGLTRHRESSVWPSGPKATSVTIPGWASGGPIGLPVPAFRTAHRRIRAAGQESLAIGAERDRVHLALMRHRRDERAARGHVPEHRGVALRSQNGLAVGAVRLRNRSAEMIKTLGERREWGLSRRDVPEAAVAGLGQGPVAVGAEGRASRPRQDWPVSR